MKKFSIVQVVGGLILVVFGLYGGLVLNGKAWSQQALNPILKPSADALVALQDELTPAPLAPISEDYRLPVPGKEPNSPLPERVPNSGGFGDSGAVRALVEPLTLPGAAYDSLMSSGHVYGSSGSAAFLAARSNIQVLMTQLRDADDDAKKADLTKQLEAAVVTIFDEDLTSREADLTKLEERLTRLRAQLDRRRKAKADIIQLQIKVFVNEAVGLGFSGASVIEPGTDNIIRAPYSWGTTGSGGGPSRSSAPAIPSLKAEDAPRN